MSNATTTTVIARRRIADIADRRVIGRIDTCVNGDCCTSSPILDAQTVAEVEQGAAETARVYREDVHGNDPAFEVTTRYTVYVSQATAPVEVESAQAVFDTHERESYEEVEVEQFEVVRALEDVLKGERGWAENIDVAVEVTEDGTIVGRWALIDDSGCADNPIELDESNGNIEWISFDNGHERNEWIWEQAEALGVDLTDDGADSVGVAFARVLTARDAQTPNRRSYAVERYEHGLVRYALLGRGYQCQWDTAPGVAVLTLITDNICGPDATDEQYDEAAKAILDEYTSWCNGDVYGFARAPLTVTVDEDDEVTVELGEVDSVWGNIGSEWAEQAIASGDF
jgi:hypothetical protein